MVNEKGCGDSRLIWNLGLLIKYFFPSMSSLKRLGIRSIGHNYASRDMPCVQRLESSLRIHIRPLIPQLNSHFLAIYSKDLQTEISVDALIKLNLCFCLLLIIILVLWKSH